MAWNPAALKSKRLFAAADALLSAMRGQDAEFASVCVWIEDPQRRAAPPAGAFSQSELVEAMKLLVRLGFARSSNDRAHG